MPSESFDIPHMQRKKQSFLPSKKLNIGLFQAQNRRLSVPSRFKFLRWSAPCPHKLYKASAYLIHPSPLVRKSNINADACCQLPFTNQPSTFFPIVVAFASGDAPRVPGRIIFPKLPSVLPAYLSSFHRGFARRRGYDVQFFRYRDRAHPEFSCPPIKWHASCLYHFRRPLKVSRWNL
jgi:hypothetical protein